MKINNTYKIGFLGLIVLAVLFFYLSTQKENINIDKKGNTIDSLYETFDKLPEGEYERTIARAQVQAYYQGKKEYYKWITEYFEKRAERDDNNTARAYLKSNKASFLLAQRKAEQAITQAREAEKDAGENDLVALGSIYNTIANAHYRMGNMDSAKYYMTKGYLFATSKKMDVLIYTFAASLGTYYYNHLLYEAASYYYGIALEAAKREKNIPLMLINNMTSILEERQRYSEADSLWSAYLPEMKKVKNPYERQLFFLNRTIHLQNTNRWEEAFPIYSEFVPEDIYEQLRVPYMHAMLNQLLHDRSDNTKVFFKKYRHWIGERYVPAVTEVFIELEKVIGLDPSLLPMDTLLAWEKKFAMAFKGNPRAVANSNKLKSLVAYKKGDLQLSYLLLEKSGQYEIADNKISDSLHQADLEARDQVTKLREEITLANFKVEEAAKQKKYESYLWFLSVAVLVGFIVALLYALSYRKTKLDFATEQITFMKMEEGHLIREQELNTRIVSLSQLIVLKAQDLGKKIKLVSSEDKETLQEVKREIEELSRLGIDDKPQLADKLIDDHQSVFDRFPDFATITNLTEKRIFILSVDGFKPKEIANVVGVSIQYVHNVRTRLRKKLKLNNSIDWESLKKG